ncbi:two-partner secretion domain-containing protein [Acaryochloris marina NIES-2412]|uniref:two-partner secretion domain-containing protein n=1 Tax=Acaryochloris marina TaxID=155978 RepID=UPI00405951AA
MYKNNLYFVFAAAIISAWYNLFKISVNAQIIPDSTLPNNSQIQRTNKTNFINGGTGVGTNLFHSFEKFSVLSGDTTHFLSRPSVENIITRVTGNSISRIDGRLRVDGNANLFFLNPNGVIFGPASQLNLGGSFLATTANSISFLDNKIFTTVGNTQNNLPLSSLQPTELIFSNTSGPISISGIGHDLKLFAPQLSSSSPINDPIFISNSLQTKPSKTFALIGRGININGGILAAPSGNLVISSISNGKVGIEKTLSGFSFSYEGESVFSDITLENRSLLRATGLNTGDIKIQGKNLSLINNSLILNSDYSDNSNGSINLKLSGDLILRGNTVASSVNPLLFSGSVPYGGIISQNFSSNSGSNITLSLNDLFVRDFGLISTANYANGKGGDISLSSKGRVSVDGNSPLPGGLLPSFITTSTTGNNSGNAGNISATGQSLDLIRGGVISSNSIATSGDTGSLNVDFQTISISGGQAVRFGPGLPLNFTSSFIGTFASSQGAANNVLIKARDLSLLDGGRINSTVSGQGSAGDIVVSVDRSLIIRGRIPGSSGATNSSRIISSAVITSPFNREFFGSPDIPTGNSGSIRVTAKSLLLADDGQLTVRNDGPNDAGSISINAKQVTIDKGFILATTASGKGGNINLSANLLKATNGEISSSAMGDGAGGNITINSDLVVALDKSNFSANAVNAQGGNIRINTTGFILSPDSQVTATSQLGEQFDGNVEVIAEITDFSQDPNLNIQTEPPDLYSACSPTYRNTLAYYRMGNGGQPISPDDKSSTSQGWLEAANARYAQRHLFYIDTETGEKKPLKRVVGWKSHGNGTITFVSDPKEADQYPAAIAAAQNTCSTKQANNG